MADCVEGVSVSNTFPAPYDAGNVLNLLTSSSHPNPNEWPIEPTRRNPNPFTLMSVSKGLACRTRSRLPYDAGNVLNLLTSSGRPNPNEWPIEPTRPNPNPFTLMSVLKGLL